MSSNYTRPTHPIINGSAMNLTQADETIIKKARAAMHAADFADLLTALSFTSLRGHSLAESLQIARRIEKEAQAHYAMWADARNNEDAFRRARRRVMIASRAAEVLAMALGVAPAPPKPKTWQDAQTREELTRYLTEPVRAAKVAQLQAAPEAVTAPARKSVAPSSRAPKSPRAAQMARFWAVVAEQGIKGSDGARRAFAAYYLGKQVKSFSQLAAEEIGRLADAVHRGDVGQGFSFSEESYLQAQAA